MHLGLWLGLLPKLVMALFCVVAGGVLVAAGVLVLMEQRMSLPALFFVAIFLSVGGSIVHVGWGLGAACWLDLRDQRDQWRLKSKS